MDNPPPQSSRPLVLEGWRNLQHQCPVAAWASWNSALLHDPNDRAAREALEHLQQSHQLPPIARGPFRFRTPDPATRERWNRQIGQQAHSDLARVADLFGALADADPDDLPAKYNQALCLAWQARNVDSIELLRQIVEEGALHDDTRELATESWMLAEILRQGAGAEQFADDINCTLDLGWDESWGEIDDWLNDRAQIHAVQIADSTSDHPAPEVLEWVSLPMPVDPAHTNAGTIPWVVATIARSDSGLRAVAPSVSDIRFVEAQFADWLGPALDVLDRRSTPLPPELMDFAAWRFRLPELGTPPQRQAWTRDALNHYYTRVWPEQPRFGLATSDDPDEPRAPKDTAGLSADERTRHRVRLDAILRVREQLLRRPGAVRLHGGHSLDQTRIQLGLDPLNQHASD